MAFWRRLLQPDQAATLAACTALDVGTEFAKALVFEVDEERKGIVRGVGRRRQGLAHMQSGTVTDIAAVVDNCQVALQEAEEMAGFRSSQVVIGIAGELVKGFTTSRSLERRRPDQPISDGELTALLESVQRDAIREAERAITWETGLPNIDIRLVHAAVTGASIDGYNVTNPVGFQGRHVRIGVFNAFAPLIHLGALQTVASSSTWSSSAIVAEPFAVARCLDGELVRQSGALFVDVGGGTTDVALVREGGVDTRACSPSADARLPSHSPIGSRSRSPGPRKSRSTSPRAQQSSSADEIGDDHRGGRRGMGRRRRARAGGIRTRAGSSQGVSTCAAAALACRSFRPPCATPNSARRLPFARPPQVEPMSPKQVARITDATDLLVDEQDVTPLALARQAIEMSGEQAPLDAALQRVVRGLKV